MGYNNPFITNPYIHGGQQGNQSYHYPERIVPPTNQTMVPYGYTGYQGPQMSSQDRYDIHSCQMNIAKWAGGGMTSGAAAGHALGQRVCIPGPAYGPCVTGYTLGGATFGAFSGGVSALQTPACHSITRTHVDANGNGHIIYGSGH